MNSSTQAGFITTDARGKGSTGHSECGNAPTASNDSSRSGCDRTGDQRSRGQAVEWNGGNCYRLERSSCLWWLTTRGTWCWSSTYSFEEMSSCSHTTFICSNQWNFHQLFWPVYAAGLPLDLQGIKPNTQTRPANDIWPRGKDNVKQKSRTWTRESYNQCTDDEIRNGACIQVGRQNPMQYLISPLDDDNIELQHPTRGLNILYIYSHAHDTKIYTSVLVFNMNIFMFKYFGGGLLGCTHSVFSATTTTTAIIIIIIIIIEPTNSQHPITNNQQWTNNHQQPSTKY